MQPIERYGVISLLFVIVTVAVVLSWDFGAGEGPGREARAATSAPPPAHKQTPAPESSSRRLDPEEARTLLRTRPKPLRRDEPAPEELAPAELAQGAAADPGARRGRPAGADPEGARQAEAGAPDLDPGRAPAANAASRPERAGTEAPAGGRPLEKPKPRLYVVRSGDTLSEIALSELGTSKRWPEIVELNPGLDPAKLRQGARLVLPPEGPAAPAAPTSTAAASEPARQEPPAASQAPAAAETGAAPRYTIQAGDSLWRIAQRTLGDGERWREIAELNPKVNPDRLLVGTPLVLPAGASVGADLTAAATPARAPRGVGTQKGVR